MAFSVYEMVTQKVIEILESGTVPWRKPWVSRDAAMPRNLVSKKLYRGINVFLLSAQRYASPYWLSFKQAKDLGGSVKKGEHGTVIVFWKVDTKQVTTTEGDDEERSSFVLRYYRVWNLEQCELPQKVLDKLPKSEEPKGDAETIEACEKIYRGMPQRPEINENGTMAFYRPSNDSITLPSRESFGIGAEFYSTAFHEMTHSTGHKSRLAREGVMGVIQFGSNDYSNEELIAEMGSAFLCAEGGISPRVIENQAAYIQSWLRRLRNDHKLVVLAAARAQRASDFILGRKFGEGESN